jgi:cytochrome c oxidase cbb3-type subunit 4
MYKDILRSIAGIEVFPLLSLCVFVSVFALVLFWTGRLDRGRLLEMSRLPLDGGDDVPAPDPIEAPNQGALL